MAINLDKMAQERAKSQKGVDDFKMPVGDTAIYIAPPARPDDDLPYIEVPMHWGLGKNNQMAICQDPVSNELMRNPHFIAAAKERGFKIGTVKIGRESKECISGGCSVCKRLEEGGLTDRQKAKRSWLWMISPVLARADARKPWANWPDGVQLLPYMSSYTVWTGIVDQFAACGDLTNPEAASYVRVVREGKGATDTKYNVQPHLESFKKPVAVSAELAALIANEMGPGGKCDPYTHLASKLRSEEDIAKMLEGTSEGDEYETDGASPEGSAEAAPGTHAPPTAAQPKGAQTKAAPAAKAAAPAKPASAPAKAAATTAKAAPAAAKPTAKAASKAAEIPACFGLDPDPGEKVCQECPHNNDCFAKCGVELPGETPEASEPEAAPEQPADEEITVAMGDCVVGTQYVLQDGTVVVYKGVGKGKHMFTQVGGTALFKLEPDDHVKQMVTADEASEPATDGGDAGGDEAADELKKLEQELLAAKSKPVKAPGKK